MYSSSNAAHRSPLISGVSRRWCRHHRCFISSPMAESPPNSSSLDISLSSSKTLATSSTGFNLKWVSPKSKKNPFFSRFVACNGRRSRRLADDRSFSSSWEASADNYFSKSTGGSAGKYQISTSRDSPRTRNPPRDRRFERPSNKEEDEDEDEDEDSEPIDDSRWSRIKANYNRIVEEEPRFERPEVRRWNREENWGRNTWKQATESSIPKLAGESLYGVNPILAALTVQKREFYTLYLQEGMDISEKNKKKKDKKSIQRIIDTAEEIGLTIKHASKHDLNMIADNRPHQGLILDASPLEMVGIKELGLASGVDRDQLWIALDEVMDPQNLGAVVRSAYFFGVEGVVLCAKNSAPLSGVVSKASAGSLEMIELRSCKNMMQFLASSAENGWRVLGGSVSSKAVPLGEVRTGVPTVLVMGSEGVGLRPLVERSCTDLVRICGGNAGGDGEEDGGKISAGRDSRPFLAVDSLNVSVAAGVLLYHLAGMSGREAHGS
ncbi:tRNA/rRNA methyltransferase (SpoU) family protein [Wolffia australiana]